MGGKTEARSKTKKPPTSQSGRKKRGGAGGRNNGARSQKEVQPTSGRDETAVDNSRRKQTCEIVQPQGFTAVNVTPSSSDKRGQARDPTPQVVISGRRKGGTISLVNPKGVLPGGSGQSAHITGGGQDGRRGGAGYGT